MKINCNFLGEGEGGAKQKTFCGGSMDIFWTAHYVKNNQDLES